MTNPGGSYPGRQLFLGLTAGGRPALAYLVTGRSVPSRERKAVRRENAVIIGPLGQQPYDPLRHYTAVKYDATCGLAVVSNGIQTEAIYEVYRLLYHTGNQPSPGYLKMVLDGAGAEPDSLKTPRIAGVVTRRKNGAVFYLGIKKSSRQATIWPLETETGKLAGIATYNGDMDHPEPYRTERGLLRLECPSNDPGEIAGQIYDISAASHQGEDIRVCAIGGVLAEDGHHWEMAIINRHQS